MINQYEVPGMIALELPGINKELTAIAPTLNIFKTVQCLVNHTRLKVKEHDLAAVKKCLSIAEKIYSKGNAIVRNAMENVFIFSFESILFTCEKEEKDKLRSMMPLCLYSAYVQQVLKSGI